MGNCLSTIDSADNIEAKLADLHPSQSTSDSSPQSKEDTRTAVAEPIFEAEECQSVINACGELGVDPSSKHFVKRTKKVSYVSKMEGRWYQLAFANYYIQNAAYNDFSGGYKREYEMMPQAYIENAAVIKALDAFKDKYDIPDGSVISTQVQTSHINASNSLDVNASFDVHVDNDEETEDEQPISAPTSSLHSKQYSITGQGIHSDGLNRGVLICLERQNIDGALNSFYNDLAGNDVYMEPFVLKEGDAVYWRDNEIYHYVSPAALKDQNTDGKRTILLFLWPGKYFLTGKKNPENDFGRLEMKTKLRMVSE